jgi:alkylation response protein AidB-like acyl-CoA dehydrogenase
MAMDIKLDNLILMESAWKIDQGTLTSKDAAMAKLFCTEMIGRVSDEAIQICGGMGLMADIPLERIWRDARIERIWEGTSEIQRHIISRSLLRPLGA